MRRSVWRKRLKVIGLVLCVMFLALWVLIVMFVSYYVPSRSQWGISLLHGRIGFGDGQVRSPGWFSTRTTHFYGRIHGRIQWDSLAADMPWTHFAHDRLGFCSLPVPVSPVRSTVASVSATFSITSKTRCMAWLSPIMPSNE